MLYYSKTTGGFYDDSIHATIPGDAVQVTADERQALLVAQSGGKVIQADASGRPQAVDRVFTAAELRATLAEQARPALSASDITLLRCAEKGVPVPAGWAAYRDALRTIANGAGGDALPSRPDYPAGS